MMGPEGRETPVAGGEPRGPSSVAEALQALGDGRLGEAGLLPIVYDELRRLARASFARLAPGQTLQATALVHEAWLKLAGDGAKVWRDRRHFFRTAAMAMRQVLVDQARRKDSIKHGGAASQTELDDVPVQSPVEDILAVDEALRRLQERHPRGHDVVTLRFFTGMREQDIAELLGVSRTTVQEDWRFARAWLMAELGDSGPAGGESR